MASSSRNNFINLEEVVHFWAHREYDKTATRRQKKIKEKEIQKKLKYLDLQIDWSKTKFVDSTVWPKLSNEDSKGENRTPNHKNYGVPTTSAPSVAILFQTKFTNNTDEDQEYTMRTEKSTRSSCSTELETGYTKGFDLSVKLMTPCEVFEANAGFHREFSLANVEGETFEEELTWGVESVIRVKSCHVAEASLVVNERKQCGQFVITTTVEGMVYVTFTNVKDNNSFVKAVGHDVADIVTEYMDRERRKGRNLDDVVKVENGQVIITTRGECKFRYGVNQEVKVDQKPI